MKTLKKYILIIGLIFFAMLLYIYFCFFIVKLSKKEYDVELKKERRHELRYNYELAKVYMNEVMLDLDLELSQNGNVYNISQYSILFSTSTKERVDKFIKNIAEIYIDYRDDGNEIGYKSLITILGLDKNFEGDLEFKVNRILQSLAFNYIKERDYYVNGDENKVSLCGLELLEEIGRLTVRKRNGNNKEIGCYVKIKNQYIKIEETKKVKEYFN